MATIRGFSACSVGCQHAIFGLSRVRKSIAIRVVETEWDIFAQNRQFCSCFEERGQCASDCNQETKKSRN